MGPQTTSKIRRFVARSHTHIHMRMDGHARMDGWASPNDRSTYPLTHSLTHLLTHSLTPSRYTTVRFRLPRAMGEVLADPTSDEHDISMIQLVPALVQRARTMLPNAFRTGIGRDYDDSDITEAIDRQNRKSIRTVVLPKVVPQSGVQEQLEAGCAVAELGCGGGNMLVALAEAFPQSTFHGYEVSAPALEHARAAVTARGLQSRVILHDARKAGEALGDEGGQKFDVVLIHDVLHDAPFPVRSTSTIGFSGSAHRRDRGGGWVVFRGLL